MLTKIQYNTQEEREFAIQDNADKTLIEEHNITDGNFLVFSSIEPLGNQLKDIKNNTDLIILKQEGLI